VLECGLLSEIVLLLADDGVGLELQETVLDLLSSLSDAGELWMQNGRCCGNDLLLCLSA